MLKQIVEIDNLPGKNQAEFIDANTTELCIVHSARFSTVLAQYQCSYPITA